jgi:methyl-accepting chemotaxis protein
MVLKSLKGKLLVAVSALVIGSGILISVLVTQRYTESLLEAITHQAESLAQAVALEATEKILINDRVALQKMLDHQMKSNPSLAYLFIFREGHILAHTFTKGVPVDLINANNPSSADEGRLQEIASKDGERYLDIAWPVFSGRAGVLRLGFSQKPFRSQVRHLWLQMSLITLGILLLALAGSLVFVKRITRPLAALAQATREIDKGDLDIKVRVTGNDEVAALASSFNQMISRINHYTTRLENQARELERSHNQTRTWCEIATEIGSLPTLHEIGPALIKRFQDILVCRDMALLILNEERQALFVLERNGSTSQTIPVK